MKKTLITLLILITLSSCKKENINTSKGKSPKELLMGKWYTSDPNIWVVEYTPTESIMNIGDSRKKILGLTDSTIYFEKLGYYPGYVIGTYKINGDTLRTGGSVGYFLKYKKDI